MPSVDASISAFPIAAKKPSGSFTGAQAIEAMLAAKGINESGLTPSELTSLVVRMSQAQEVYPQNTTELISAINAGSIINLGQGKSFTFTQGYSFLNKPVTIRGKARFIVDYSINPGGFTPLNFEYDFIDPQSVIDIADVDYDFGGGLTRVSRLQVADAANYSVGNVVKVISSDQIPWLNPVDGQKMGSVHTVGAVDSGNNYLYLLDTVYHAFLTNIKVAKYNQGIEFDINAEIKWSKTGTHTGNTRRATLHVKGGYKPIVKGMEADGLYGEFISFTGCYLPKTKRNFGESLITQTANDQYGYVVVERSCAYGEHVENAGNNVRHVYTNGACFHPDPDDFAAYGCNEYGETSRSRGFQCSSTVDDTHPGSYRCVLRDTQVYYPQRGQDGALWSVQVRGVEDAIVSPVIHGGDAIVVRKEYAHEKLASGITVDNPIYYAKAGESIIAPFRVEGLAGSRIKNLKIRGAVVNDSNPISLLSAKHAEIFFDNNDCKCKLDGAGSVGPFDIEDTKLEIIGGRVDITGSTASNIRHSLLTDSNSEITCRNNHKMITGGADWAVITDFKNAAGKAYYYDLECDVKPEFINPGANRGAGAVFRWGYEVNNGLAVGSNILALTKTSDFSLNGNRLEELTHKEILVEVDISGAGGLTQLTAIPAGNIFGQKLCVSNRFDSVNSLQINSGGNVGRANSITLLPGESKTFTWSSSSKWIG